MRPTYMTLREAAASAARWVVSGISLSTPASVSALQAVDALTPAGSRVQKTGCWISSAGCTTDLHYDAFGPHNIHLLLAGRKRALLFAFDQAPHLYCYGGPRYLTRYAAAVDAARPDLSRFPEYAHAVGLEVTLSAGDCLFIPAYWWHHFEHLGEFNVSVTRWFDEPAGELRFRSGTALQ